MLNLKPEDEPINFLFVDDGEINEEIVKYTGKSKEWLYNALQKRYTTIHDILYAEGSETEGFYIQIYSSNRANLRKEN